MAGVSWLQLPLGLAWHVVPAHIPMASLHYLLPGVMQKQEKELLVVGQAKQYLDGCNSSPTRKLCVLAEAKAEAVLSGGCGWTALGSSRQGSAQCRVPQG